MLGCTSPTAKNYNSAATVDDGTCVWLNDIAGTCYEFTEVPADQLTDNSFTISLALNPETMRPEGWAFFHDYFPDAYIHTRQKLLNLKDNGIFFHSKGAKGIYHHNTDPQPFFIDVLLAGLPALNEAPYARYQQAFRPWPALILNSVNWVSEVRAPGNDPIDDNQRALCSCGDNHLDHHLEPVPDNR